MKKKFISVAMFLALAVSSPVWVGCSDYDDDIANLQSQVDGLKQSVDVTTAEAISALQSAQGELQADIEDLTTSTGVTSTDVETLKNQIAAMQAALDANDITEAGQLAADVQNLISKINDEVSPELEQLQADLAQQKTDLEAQITELNGKLEQLQGEMASAEDITALQGQIDEINTTLGTINENYVDVSNRLNTVETWMTTNGTELAKLTAKVSQIESLLTYLDAEKQAGIDQVTDPEVLANILALETTNQNVTNLQQQIGSDTEANTVLYRLAQLESWKNNIQAELLAGTNYSTFADVCAKIAELEAALSGSGEEGETGMQEQLNYLQGEFNKLAAQMEALAKIQSVVYVPNGDAYQLTTSVLKVWNGTDYVEVAQGVNNNTIDFRVSPASLAKDFIGENPKYALTFDGQKVKAFNNVEVDGEPTMVDETAGIIRYKVKTQFEAGATYAVCAVIKGIESAGEAEGETVAADGTDLTTTYFLAKSEVDNVHSVKIISPNGSETEMPYENPDGTASSIDYGTGLVVEGYNSSKTKIVANLVEKYGVPTTFEYNEDSDPNNWFQVSAEGVLTLTNPSNAMIGRSVEITPVAVFGNIKMASTQPFSQVTVTRRVVEHHVAEVKNIQWSQNDQFIALTTAEMDEIIDKTELSRGDYNELWTRNQPSSKPTTITLITGEVLKANATAWGLTLPSTIDMANRDNTIYLYIPAEANVNIGGELKVTLYDGSAQGSSTTQTDSYEIYVEYNAMTYPVTSIDWNTARWNGGTNVELQFLPQITMDGDKVDKVGNLFNAKDLFANYNELKDKVESLGAELVVAMENSVTGIEEVTTPKDDEIYKYLKDTYDGTPMKINIYIDYNGHKEAENSCVVSTANLSGTWTNPTTMNLEVDNLSQTYNIAAGAQWKDIQGRLMWENGSEATTSPDYKFKNSPFETNADGYYLTAPTFKIVKVQGKDANTCEYIMSNTEFEKNGTITFTDAAKQLVFANPYEVVIRISADSPWGPINGLTDDYVDVTLTIKEGAKAY